MRSNSANPFGKCTEEIKTKVPFEIKEGVARLANENGVSESEIIREIITIRVIGYEGWLKIHDARLKSMAGIGQEQGNKP